MLREFLKVNFIPNAPGRRRFTYLLNEMDAKIGDGFYGRSEKLQHKPSQVLDKTSLLHKPSQVLQKSIQPTQTNEPTHTIIQPKEITVAKAIRESTPDVYELFN